MRDSAPLLRPAPALWVRTHPWVLAVLFALVPVFCTALASALAQLVFASAGVSALIITAGAAVSAALGLVVMRRSRLGFRAFGFRAPVNLRAAWWLLVPVVSVLIVLFTGGITVSATTAAASLLLAVVVGLNEEIWFRGLIIALLRPRSIRAALIGSSALFGVFHLANLAGGQELGPSLLQVAFAALFGLACAELVIITGSLWVTIVWHFAWNATSFLGGNQATQLALTGVGIASALILVYCLPLWRTATAMDARPASERR